MKIFNLDTLQGIDIEKSHLLVCLQFCSKCGRLVNACKLISSFLQKETKRKLFFALVGTNDKVFYI